MKFEAFILGIDQKRKKGWGEEEERVLKKGTERGQRYKREKRQKGTELTI